MRITPAGCGTPARSHLFQHSDRDSFKQVRQKAMTLQPSRNGGEHSLRARRMTAQCSLLGLKHTLPGIVRRTSRPSQQSTVGDSTLAACEKMARRSAGVLTMKANQRRPLDSDCCCRQRPACAHPRGATKRHSGELGPAFGSYSPVIPAQGPVPFRSPPPFALSLPPPPP